MLTNIKGETDHNTTVGDFNTLKAMDRSSRQKINRETQHLNNPLEELDLIDTNRAFNFNKTGFFSTAHGTFSRVDHIFSHNSSLNKFKNLKSFQASFLTIIL